jgi:hypothetical protein
LALIFCAKLAVWGVVTVTVKEGLATLVDLPSSAAHATPAAPVNAQIPAHTQTPHFFMTLHFASRLNGEQRV